ncbi:hypothetical protein [Sunxiuqinia dokdonensis]|uniref:Integral membrane protein n=1 Tax=Sunxiuqinia dokdonensis TaxID=1409788 RepID=A0A0L8V2T8_9BACT|nr:hypothetical protein [Sunxiuqinia dokdonensis]KOH42668.1 hypothetical protein NC99_45040 [Sunxiuqinia dokdonensis]
MNYFQILGVGFGIVALLKPFYMHVLPWDENKFIAETYTEERPNWILPIAIMGLVLVCYTWYKELTTEIRYSLIITIMFSLTAIKAVFFIFDYSKFQKWVAGLLIKNKGKNVVIVDVFAGIFGLVLIAASFFLL